MSTKVYTSADVNKWGIQDKGESIEYETQPNRSCLVLLVGVLLVVALVIFIVKHWSAESLLLAGALVPLHDTDESNNVFVIVIGLIVLLIGVPAAFILA